MNEKKTTLEEQLSKGLPIISFTVGNSMEPLLFHRNTHVVIMKAGRELVRGDIPLYKRPGGSYVMHRIVRLDEESYYTRGDNRTGVECIPKEWVIGVVTEIFRRERLSHKEKRIHVSDRGYRLYVWFWDIIYPLRWIACKVHALRCRMRNLKKEDKAI